MLCVKLSMFYVHILLLQWYIYERHCIGLPSNSLTIGHFLLPMCFQDHPLLWQISLLSIQRPTYIQHAILLTGLACNTTSIHGHTMGIQCTNHSQSVRVQLCAILLVTVWKFWSLLLVPVTLILCKTTWLKAYWSHG